MLANGVRVQQIMRTRVNPAIESGEPDKEGEEILYQTAEDELLDLLGGAWNNAGQPAATFFRFLDVTGRVVPPGPGIDAGLKRNAAVRATLNQRLASLRPALTNEAFQQVGYLPVIRANGQPLLTEVLLTRLIDPVSGECQGALVIGFPVHLEPPGPGELLTGIHAGGELFANGASAETVAVVRQRVGQTERAGPGDMIFRAPTRWVCIRWRRPGGNKPLCAPESSVWACSPLPWHWWRVFSSPTA
jgi:hypothetical protein